MSGAVRVGDAARPPLARECGARPRRAGASRRHERILAAARAVLVEDAPAASIEEGSRCSSPNEPSRSFAGLTHDPPLPVPAHRR